MRQLAAAADARWASIPSALKAPSKNNPSISALLPKSGTIDTDVKSQVVKNSSPEKISEVPIVEEEGKSKKKVPSPWTAPIFGKEGEQQPESWTPKLAKRR